MPMLSRLLTRAAVAGAAAFAFVALSTTATVQAQGLKKYDSTTKEFWNNPPPDWFLGDETEEQKGLTLPSGPATPLPMAELEANLKKIKLPKGFKIGVFAQGVPDARQMAWGDKGTLFVGSFLLGQVSAVVDQGGKKTVKPVIKGLTIPTGVAFRDGNLYVVSINKLMMYENAEANLDKMPEAKVVYDDMPPYVPHGWKYLVFDKEGWLYLAVGVPCNICMPPPATGQIRRVNPKNGIAELIAIGQRNSVGGDIDPRTGDFWFTENGRDWFGDDKPSDKLNHVSRRGQHFGYPYCHQGDMPDPKYNAGQKCSQFTKPVVKLGAHVAPLGMKFYTGSQFPAEYQNNIFIAEHGSWNRHKYQGARIMRVTVDPDGKNAKQTVFASGWLAGDRKYLGRPSDILQAPDGSLLVADDWAGAIYRISYSP